MVGVVYSSRLVMAVLVAAPVVATVAVDRQENVVAATCYTPRRAKNSSIIRSTIQTAASKPTLAHQHKRPLQAQSCRAPAPASRPQPVTCLLWQPTPDPASSLVFLAWLPISIKRNLTQTSLAPRIISSLIAPSPPPSSSSSTQLSRPSSMSSNA